MDKETKEFINEKIEELYNSLMEKPLEVLSIFNDFFEENRVDMQKYPSLDEFKSWINTSSICLYISNIVFNTIVDTNSFDWKEYRLKCINELPDDTAKKIAENFTKDTIKTRISHELFNNIFILVHFPNVRITNEHNKFVDINHLWAKIQISPEGCINGGFKLNRSEYTLLHFNSNYLHSHINGIPKENFKNFKSPCLGRGPIINTITSLSIHYDKDLWNMFCLELDKYVTVESLSGTPYYKLEKLGTNYMTEDSGNFVTYLSLFYNKSNTLSIDKLKEFIRYFINLKKLKFNYVNGSYSIGMSFVEFNVLISNEFIKWYNDQLDKKLLNVKFEDLKRYSFLRECVISNERIYYDSYIKNIDRYLEYIGEKVCTFKGKDITINITDISKIENNNKSIIINTPISLYILTIVLKVLNYRYGRSKAIREEHQFGTEVRYL